MHRCVAKPPVSNVTEVIPNKPDVIPNTVSNAVSNKAGTAKTATRLQTRMVQVASQKLNSGRDDAPRSVSLTSNQHDEPLPSGDAGVEVEEIAQSDADAQHPRSEDPVRTG
jgi:hypothetical protein